MHEEAAGEAETNSEYKQHRSQDMDPRKFLLIHNEYGSPSGEESEFATIVKTLTDHGHTVATHTRTSSEVAGNPLGKLRAALSGVYNPSSRREVSTFLGQFKPDYVIVQNLFPLISPSVLPVIAATGVPILMRVANYRLMCPNGLHLSHGRVCEKCLHGREYWCLLKNCEEDLFKSAAYALRSATARLMGFYRDNVGGYLCASRFLRDRLIAAGFEAARLHVIPNALADGRLRAGADAASVGSFVGYVGRISREKGIPTLLEAARANPDIPFRLAGRVSPSFSFPGPKPENVALMGFLEGEQLAAFYQASRLIVSASLCFETFGMSIAEAMLNGKPVVVPDAGVFPELVRDGVTGVLADPTSPRAFSERIRYLWERPDVGLEMGRNGKAWASGEYSAERCYERLCAVFESPILRVRPAARE
jgi:glycosyltransferase involved in cell wall biosynthesis